MRVIAAAAAVAAAHFDQQSNFTVLRFFGSLLLKFILFSSTLIYVLGNTQRFVPVKLFIASLQFKN